MGFFFDKVVSESIFDGAVEESGFPHYTVTVVITGVQIPSVPPFLVSRTSRLTARLSLDQAVRQCDGQGVATATQQKRQERIRINGSDSTTIPYHA